MIVPDWVDVHRAKDTALVCARVERVEVRVWHLDGRRVSAAHAHIRINDPAVLQRDLGV
jgi:hypothetical protein